jgi:nitroimidazol reductase NimA-like FMN-containing flavoprotein (pyridoxamine 5'-phosphate oxidase superfamily)
VDVNVLLKVDNYLREHIFLTLATVSPEGKPMAHAVDYVHENALVYFLTDKNTRKVQNILQNEHVFISVYEDHEEVADCRAVQINGTADVIAEPEEKQRVIKMLIAKIPTLAKLPPNPNSAVVRIKLGSGHLIDNTVHMGYRGIVDFCDTTA